MENLQPHLFHFFSYRYAIRFHIARILEAYGWGKSTRAADAIFTDLNLTLNDEISERLEHKHLLAQLVQQHCHEVMPVTYCVNDDNYSHVFAKMIYQHYLKNNQYVSNINGLKWILKPSTLNNGDQIHLFNNVEELKKYYAKTDRLGGNHVIQQYLPNPDLIEKRKYTFRMPVVMTNYAGVFIYRQGYVNISSQPFNLEDGFQNRKVHITNYVIDGEFAHIEQRSTQQIKDFDTVFSQMRNIVASVMRGLLKISPDYLKKSPINIFEIFGFDFICDDTGKVWLLEINQGPDTPTFEENALNEILWDKFWEDIRDDFVLPIALKTKPKRNYKNFTCVLKSKECFSLWRSILKKFWN